MRKRNNLKEIANSVFGPTGEAGVKEEWIWVKGFKGTYYDMSCNGYQYELDKQFDMPDDAEVKLCESGFHLCPILKDVYRYYQIGGGNRFFEVEALVSKDEYERVTKSYSSPSEWFIASLSMSRNDKLTSKSIKFIRELSADEILEAYYNKDEISEWTPEEKQEAITGIDGARGVFNKIEARKKAAENKIKIDQLIALGYNEYLAAYFVDNGYFKKAFALGNQEGLSMDLRIFAIFRDSDED